MKRMSYLCITVLTILLVVSSANFGQEGTKPTQPAEPQKANARPVEVPPAAPEPFDGASVEKMASRCVTLHTELGAIEIEMIPEAAPEAVRNFLNLSATGALDTTAFSRTVKGFIIQGGNLSTSEKWSAELAKRMTRTLPDEPGLIAHVRGIVSMARTDEPNSATTHFFILVGEGRHLDSKFAAFGRVKKGIEVADAINQAPTEGERPVKPIRIERAVVNSCGR
jgi:peptidyl-prolyl cis-trans isomerase B (cyclophilin B)